MDTSILKNQKAFTLIEVLVSLLILASISIYTAQSIRSSAQLKTKLQGKIDRQAKFRAALNLIHRDIHLAFNARDLNLEMYENIKKNEKKYLPAPATPNPGDPAPPPANTSIIDLKKYKYENKDPTLFMGEKDSFHFTNLGGIRNQENQRKSTQQEVGYYVKTCRNRIDPQISYNCLWRRNSTEIDDQVESGGDELVVLENIKVFKMRYFGEGKDDWVDIWLSNDRGDDITRGKFPQAVEVSISFEEDGKLEESVLVVALPFPNNQKTKPKEQETGIPGP